MVKAEPRPLACPGLAAEAPAAEEACNKRAILYRNMGKWSEIQNSGANSAGHFFGSVLRVRCWVAG